MKICIAFTVLSYLVVFASSDGQVTPVDVQFVLSARSLPEMGILDKKPDPYVEVTYFRSPDTAPDYFTSKTKDLNDDFNPVWPEVFQMLFFEGHKQKLRFVIKDHNIGKDEEIGSLTVSLSEIVKAPNHKLEKDIIGKKLQNGILIIRTLINKETLDDTDERLINPQEKVIKLKRIVEIAD